MTYQHGLHCPSFSCFFAEDLPAKLIFRSPSPKSYCFWLLDASNTLETRLVAPYLAVAIGDKLLAFPFHFYPPITSSFWSKWTVLTTMNSCSSSSSHSLIAYSLLILAIKVGSLPDQIPRDNGFDLASNLKGNLDSNVRAMTEIDALLARSDKVNL